MTTAILPGCEPFDAAGGDVGVLVLHGFTGNPSSMRPLAEFLADEGFTVSLPRLPGHGTSVADMMTTSWSDWTGAALDAYDDLARRTARVAVVGLSMGGGLGALVAQRRDVGALVLINPLVKPPAPEMIDGLNQLIDAGLSTVDAIGSDVKREGVSEIAYDATPLACAKSLFAGIAEVYDELATITAPSLLLSSREDHVVSADNGDDLVARVRGPIERVWLENSYHVATIDYDQPIVQSLTRDFIRQTVAS